MIVFAAVVFVSFLYLISNGALTWGPSKALQSGLPRSDVGVDHHPDQCIQKNPRARRPDRMGFEDLQHNFLTGRMEDLVKWARRNSVWPATFGLACCAIEMISVGAADYDISRLGMEVFRGSPRQADLMIVAGRVSQKMAPVLRQIYDQ